MFKAASVAFALLTSTAAIAAPAKFTPGSYQLDPAHSKVGFEIPHLVISSVEGRFTSFDGEVTLGEKFDKSSVKANVDMTSIDTGNEKRDDHLKSPDFFEVQKHPKMVFESTEIKGKPESFKMTGNLTIKGITKKVTFDGKFLGAAVDAMGNQKAAFNAKTKINRKDFGLTWNKAVEAGPVVGDEVTIDLKVQAGRPLEKAAEKK